MVDLKKIVLEGHLLVDAPMKEYTTFKTGGPAAVLVNIYGLNELSSVVGLLKEKQVPYTLVGNGSNLLVSDKGYDGVVIRLRGSFDSFTAKGNVIESGAGAALSRLCSFAAQEGLSGLEFAYGIPGTVGGALVMNAGAYDGEIAGVVSSVTLMDPDGKVRTVSGKEMNFSYRDSLLKHEDYIAVAAEFTLSKGKIEDIQFKMQDFLGRRKSKQPLEYPSAGSTFKRPEGYFAGKLIEDAGLAGRFVGGACVSKKHCGFIVNDGGASSEDISNLMKIVQDEVFAKFGVMLEPEVIKLGNF